MAPRAGRHLPNVGTFRLAKNGPKGNININDIQQGDLIRIEIDLFGRAYGEESTYRLLVLDVHNGETNLHTGFWNITGIDLATNEKFQKFYEPHRMELFLEARCDPQSKK